MLTAVAEMERDLLVERTQAGLARAKAEGKTLGIPTKTTASQRAEIIDRRSQDAWRKRTVPDLWRIAGQHHAGDG